MKRFVAEFLRRRLDPAERYGVRLSLFLLALWLLTVPFAFLVITVLRRGSLLDIDTSAARHLPQYARGSEELRATLELVSFFGWPPWLWVLIGGVALNLWVRQRQRLVAFLLSTTLGGSLLNTLVKLSVDRPRPPIEYRTGTTVYADRSFPSGHTMGSTVAYGALLLIALPLVPKRWRRPLVAVAVALPLAVGASRLFLGVHYISDVAAGFILGLAWLSLSTAAFTVWREDRSPRELPEAQPGGT